MMKTRRVLDLGASDHLAEPKPVPEPKRGGKSRDCQNWQHLADKGRRYAAVVSQQPRPCAERCRGIQVRRSRILFSQHRNLDSGCWESRRKQTVDFWGRGTNAWFHSPRGFSREIELLPVFAFVIFLPLL